MTTTEHWFVAKCSLDCKCGEDGCCEFSRFDLEYVSAVRFHKCRKSAKKVQKSLKYRDGTFVFTNNEW
jgi:hypothetical protein